MNMKTSNPNSDILLGVGLDILHRESLEWLETVAFWKDETRFFADLLHKKDGGELEYGKMLSNLDKIHENLFDYLVDDIISHEKLLARLEKGEKGIADVDYRDRHKNLKKRMQLFTSDFRDFKKMVFRYVKKL